RGKYWMPEIPPAEIDPDDAREHGLEPLHEADAPPSVNGPEPTRVRVPRPGSTPNVEATEIVRGAKPGSRFARRVRTAERHFERGTEEGTYRATSRATAPRSR